VHAFAWSADGTAIYYAVTAPLTHEQEEAKKADWKDVVRYREQHRGDLLLKQAVAPALAKALTVESPRRRTLRERLTTPRKLTRALRRCLRMRRRLRRASCRSQRLRLRRMGRAWRL